MRSERFAFTVKKFQLDNPETTQKDNILADIIEFFEEKYFHTF